MPIQIKEEKLDSKFGLTFSEDLSCLLYYIAQESGNPEFIDKVHGESFNVSCEEKINLKDFYKILVKK